MNKTSSVLLLEITINGFSFARLETTKSDFAFLKLKKFFQKKQ